MKLIAKEDRIKIWQRLKLDEAGLVSCIAVSETDQRVLMLAYMNQEAFERTWETGFMHYYSRSRQALWFKGESSANTQQVISCSVDCDQDALLFYIEEAGPACHTGQRSCFYRDIIDLIDEEYETK